MNCKCSHSKEEHKKGFSLIRPCNNCPCNEFVNRDGPTKSDKLVLAYGIGFILFATACIILLYVVALEPDEKSLERTVREWLDMVVITFAGMGIFAITIVSFLTILPYYINKKRRVF